MAPPPAKKQKRLVILSSDDENEETGPSSKTVKAARLSFGPTTDAILPTRSPNKTNSASQNSQSAPNKANAAGSPRKPKAAAVDKGRTAPIQSFFSGPILVKAKEINIEKPPDPELAVEIEDVIQDDSFDDEPTRSSFKKPKQVVDRNGQKRQHTESSSQEDVGEGRHVKSSQRFLSTANGNTESSTTKTLAKKAPRDPRPWAEKYGPSSLEELAVHKKKVADVRMWLDSVLSGRERQRLLILKGPSGCGKTATVASLAKALNFEITEWRNPDFATQGHQSMSSQFDDFLGRGSLFGNLSMEQSIAVEKSSGSAGSEPTSRKVILLEEFPSTSFRISSALQAFRSSLMQFLAANVPSVGIQFTKQQNGPQRIIPMIMVISETLVTASTAVADSFTAHRLLGAEILSHPGVRVIEFNPIAATILSRALDLMIQKEARDSGRRRTPGAAVLKKLGSIGDIRSAIGSLEFMCVRGDEGADWSGTVASKGKKGAKETAGLSHKERKSLLSITERGSTLDIFHAVGKVVHNKRQDASMAGEGVESPVQPPEYLSEHARAKIPEVIVDTLMDETGADIPTFIAALQENYILSCECARTMDALNGCIDALSDSDTLLTDRGGNSNGRGSASRMHQISSLDTLRQSEISFQLAVRGILFALPSPVKRHAVPDPEKTGGRVDAYKMYYPTSLRLWKQIDEVESLVEKWTDNSLVRYGSSGSDSMLVPAPGSVETWRNRSWNFQAVERSEAASLELRPSNSARLEMILERLPYVARIAEQEHESQSLRDLHKVVRFRGLPVHRTDTIPDEDDEDDSILESSPALPSQAHNEAGSQIAQAHSPAGKKAPHSRHEASSTVAQAVFKLVLSDDDIEDD